MQKLFFAMLTLMTCLTSYSQAENPTDFTVQSALDDTKFQLSEHRGKTVVLHFLLKTECPYCLCAIHAITHC